MRHILIFLTACIFVAAQFGFSSAQASQTQIYQNFFGTAIKGTDPVSYFTQGRPVAGNADITHEWNGATWHFSSIENRDRFAASPETYAPRYGGYCAWAVAQGYTASTDPQAWTIVDGKLYLNYSKSVRKKWKTDISGHIVSADKNWPGILD